MRISKSGFRAGFGDSEKNPDINYIFLHFKFFFGSGNPGSEISGPRRPARCRALVRTGRYFFFWNITTFLLKSQFESLFLWLSTKHIRVYYILELTQEKLRRNENESTVPNGSIGSDASSTGESENSIF